MPELKKSFVTPQPVRQDILLPDAFPSLPESFRARFGKDAAEFDEESKRWWQRTKRVLVDAHFELAQPQNVIKEDTRNIRKEFVAADAVLSASFTETIEIVVTDVSALALRTLNLEASIDTPGTGLLARVSLVESAYVDATEAEAISTATISASIASPTAGTIGARITIESNARATVDGYFAGKYSMNVGVGGPTIISGLLVIGRAYQITAAGGNFVNVGAPSNGLGVRFVATGTTPTAYGTGEVRQLITTGMNVSSVTDGGFNTNEIVFQTDRFRLQTASGTPVQLLDVTSDGFVFGTDLASDNFDPGVEGWRLTRAGRLVAVEGNVGGFEISPKRLYGVSSGGWGDRWVDLNIDNGVAPYIKIGSSVGVVALSAVSTTGYQGNGTSPRWSLDEAAGGGNLRLWNSTPTVTIEMSGQTGDADFPGDVTANSLDVGSSFVKCGSVQVGSYQVVGAQLTAVASADNSTATTTIVAADMAGADTVSKAWFVSYLNALGVIVNGNATKQNTLRDRIQTHGLIAT